MRTVIYVGLLSIAGAINQDWHQGAYIEIYAMIFIVAVIFDIADFLSKR